MSHDPDHPSSHESSRMVFWIVLGVFLWGTLHAVGAYMFNWNIWRAVVVIICVDGFLAFWLLLLWMNRNRRRG